MLKSALFGSACLVALFTAPALAHAPGKDEAREAAFDKLIDPAEMNKWLESFAAQPNHVGSPHDKANAEKTLQQFKDWGWDVRIETFKVLYPTPIDVKVDLLGDNGFSANLHEKPIEGDAPTETPDALPAYLAYQGDGDVTAPIVYVNYGMPDDYEALKRMGVNVEGKIVLTRYGGGWRGLKPKLAQQHGAVGCLIYSDPHDDGYAVDDVYPKGPARPEQGVQRGSVMDMTTYPGDPLTPGRGATDRAKRLRRSASKVILKIPALPIGYGDATKILGAMGGQVAPESFRGSLGETYHIGDDAEAKVHLVVKSDWSLKPAYNVVAMMKGSARPDEWVLRGNHRDGWVMGATDPLSGHIAMMAEAKAIGELVKEGWKPKRTIVYLSWDAEEPGLIGSTEWAETHADELKKKAVLYINSDSNARGFLYAGGSHSLQHFVNEASKDVTDPQTSVSVEKRRRAAFATNDGSGPGAQKYREIASDPSRDLPLYALGSGSDYSTFLQHLGLAALNIGFGGEGSSGGVYHSLYDDFKHHNTFVDPGSVYSGTLAETIGRIVMRAADANAPFFRYKDFASTVSDYLGEVEKLADGKRKAADAQAGALKAGQFKLAADPTKGYGEPTALKPVPHFNFAPLKDAVDRLKKSAAAYDAALDKNADNLTDAQSASLFALAREAEAALTDKTGLPGRPWYRHMIYAPGTLTGYGAKTFPGVREAIEQERFDDVDKYAVIIAKSLNRYADKLDAGVKVMAP